jgi:hypothetical protein
VIGGIIGDSGSSVLRGRWNGALLLMPLSATRTLIWFGDFIPSMSPGEEEVGKSVIEDRIPGKGF